MNKGNEKINIGIRTVIIPGGKKGDAIKEEHTGVLIVEVMIYFLLWGW